MYCLATFFFFCKHVFCKLYTARLILFPFLLGEAKQKAFAPADGRNRRVLQDIGNLVNDRVSNIFWCDHFVTGSRVLLEPHLMNAFDTFLQKPITEVVDYVVARNVRAPAATKVPAAAIKKVNEKHRPEDVIVISSEETEKSKPVSRVPRKEVKTLTSILTTRSKVIREFRFWFMYNLFYPFDCLFTVLLMWFVTLGRLW